MPRVRYRLLKKTIKLINTNSRQSLLRPYLARLINVTHSPTQTNQPTTQIMVWKPLSSIVMASLYDRLLKKQWHNYTNLS